MQVWKGWLVTGAQTADQESQRGMDESVRGGELKVARGDSGSMQEPSADCPFPEIRSRVGVRRGRGVLAGEMGRG